MMSQTHIGYTGWQQPEQDVMPEVRTLAVPAAASMGLGIEGDTRAWPQTGGKPALPAIDRLSDQTRTIEIFNRGAGSFRFEASSPAPWVKLSRTAGEMQGSERILVGIDWTKAPGGSGEAAVTVRGPDGSQVTVVVSTSNPPDALQARGFVETNGAVAIEAAHYGAAVPANGLSWDVIPNLGRTNSAVTAFPMTKPPQAPGKGPRLEYPIYLFSSGEIALEVLTSPDLDFRGNGGLRYAVSIDDDPPQVVNVEPDRSEQAWGRAVASNVRVGRTQHRIARPGAHVVKLWLIDPGLVFQRLVLNTAPLPASYLGPIESPHVPAQAPR